MDAEIDKHIDKQADRLTYTHTHSYTDRQNYDVSFGLFNFKETIFHIVMKQGLLMPEEKGKCDSNLDLISPKS
jgi:hypothetical protein